MTLQRIAIGWLCLAWPLGQSAGGQDPHELQARLDETLAGDWLGNAEWVFDFDEAKEIAEDTDRQIFVYFTPSFSSSQGEVVEEGLFSSEEFADWSEDFVLYLHVTTHLKDREHEGLAGDYLNYQWPPGIAFLNSSGRLLARQALGSLSSSELRKHQAAAATYAADLVQATEKDQAAQHRLFVADLAMTRYSFARASLKFSMWKADMTPERRARAAQLLIDTQYRELRRELEIEFDPGTQAREHQERLYALHIEFYRAGRLPVGNEGLFVAMTVMNSAKQMRDAELYAAAHAHSQRILLGLADEDHTDEAEKEGGDSTSEDRRSDSPHSEPADLPGARPTAADVTVPRPVDAPRMHEMPEEVATIVRQAADLLVGLQENFVPEPIDLPEGEPVRQWQQRVRQRIAELRDNPKDGYAWTYASESIDGLDLVDRVACTAIVCKAITLGSDYAERRDHRDAVERAVEFLLRELTHNPVLQSGRGNDARRWSHAYALDFLGFALRHRLLNSEHELRAKETIPRLIACIEEGAWPCGWSYGGHDPSSPFLTGITLLALYEARALGFAVDGAAVELGLRGLQNCRTDQGGYAYSGGLTPADTGTMFAAVYATPEGSCARAALAELCLLLADRGTVPRLRFAVQNFFANWDELYANQGRPGKHGAPYGVAPYYFMFAHTSAALAIEALPEEHRPPLRLQMREVLMRSRDSDGGWNESISPYNRAYSTAMAVLVLTAPYTSPVPTWSGDP